jgi:hypothetical protein
MSLALCIYDQTRKTVNLLITGKISDCCWCHAHLLSNISGYFILKKKIQKILKVVGLVAIDSWRSATDSDTELSTEPHSRQPTHSCTAYGHKPGFPQFPVSIVPPCPKQVPLRYL